MENTKLGSILFTFLLFSTSACAQHIQAMTGAEKQTSLEKFQQAILQAENSSSSQSGTLRTATCSQVDGKQECIVELSQPPTSNLQGWVSDDRYFLELKYINENNYPRLYGGADTFKDNTSIEFKENTTDLILTDYLSSNHALFKADLITVHNEFVLIRAYVKNSEEFEAFLSDSRLISVVHAGHKNESIMVK